MADWYVGQKIVCVTDVWVPHGNVHHMNGIPIGKVCTIAEIILNISWAPGDWQQDIPFFSLLGMGADRFSHRGFRPLEEIHNKQFQKLVEPTELAKVKKREGVDHELVQLEQKAQHDATLHELHEFGGGGGVGRNPGSKPGSKPGDLQATLPLLLGAFLSKLVMTHTPIDETVIKRFLDSVIGSPNSVTMDELRKKFDFRYGQ